MIFGMGMIELGNTFSYSQLIIDDWIVSKIKDMFSTQPSKQFIWPELALASGIDDKKHDFVAKACYKAKAILAHHKPLLVSNLIKKKFSQIITEANEHKTGYKRGECGDKSKRSYA